MCRRVRAASDSILRWEDDASIETVFMEDVVTEAKAASLWFSGGWRSQCSVTEVTDLE